MRDGREEDISGGGHDSTVVACGGGEGRLSVRDVRGDGIIGEWTQLYLVSLRRGGEIISEKCYGRGE